MPRSVFEKHCLQPSAVKKTTSHRTHRSKLCTYIILLMKNAENLFSADFISDIPFHGILSSLTTFYCAL